MNKIDVEKSVYAQIEKRASIMQYPRELIPFIQFLIDHNVQSYLEIGIKNGGLITFLADLLPLERVYACDINRPEILAAYCL